MATQPFAEFGYESAKIVRLPTAAPRPVQQPSARAVREYREAHPWPGRVLGLPEVRTFHSLKQAIFALDATAEWSGVGRDFIEFIRQRAS